MEQIVYKNGVHEITNAEYHSSAGISRSMLMEFKRSPYHYWYKYLSGLATRQEATPDMNLGSAVHTLVLEEELFDSEFYIIHQQTRPRKNTPPHEKMMADAQGKIILTNDEYLQAALMAKSVRDNEQAVQLLQDCAVERSIYFTHEKTGLQVKSRPDAWCNGIVIDLKTTVDASLRGMQSSAMTYGYFLQAALCSEALKSLNQTMEHFVFLTVEKKAPFCTAIYMTDGQAIDYGIEQFDSLMEGLSKCIKEDYWPGYGIKDLTLPGYAKFDIALEIE